MRLIFFGNPKFALPSLNKLASSSHEIACVVTSPDRPSGRGRKLRPPEVAVKAKELGLPLVQVEKLKDKDFLEKISSFAAALFVVVAFRILPPQLFEIPPHGAINLHASLLPKYRGAAPINWAIMRGEKATGVTTFQIKKRVDTGDVLLQKEVPIHLDDDYDSLYERLSQTGADLLVETVDRIERGDIEPVSQDPSEATSAPKLTPEHGEIDWSRPAAEIRDQIRGLSSKPGAYTFRDGDKLKIYRSEPVEAAKPGYTPGRIVDNSATNGLVVAAGDVWLKLLEVQPAGKQRMKADDYLRGNPPKSGEVLG